MIRSHRYLIHLTDASFLEDMGHLFLCLCFSLTPLRCNVESVFTTAQESLPVLRVTTRPGQAGRTLTRKADMFIFALVLSIVVEEVSTSFVSDCGNLAVIIFVRACERRGLLRQGRNPTSFQTI